MSVGWILLHPTGPETAPTALPTPSIHRVTPATPAAPLPVAPDVPSATPAPDVVINASVPLRLTLPSIGIDGAVSKYTQSMIDSRGGFDPTELTTIAWDTTIAGGLAGTDSTNTVYLYGHSWVDTAVFNDLKDLRPGAVASIDTANGRLCYVEQKSLKLDKAQYKNNDELTDAIPNRLVLVSCYRPVGYDPNSATVQNIVAVLQLDQDKTNVGC
ncbi:sortase [Cryobacterium sp. TMT1-21]|nr:sortase [Cryobacterium sp. TMT1-21]TFD20951.1 sortase [Cryobacterium sp. TMT4-10]